MAGLSLLLCAFLATAAPPTRYVVLPFVVSPPGESLPWLAEAFAWSVTGRLETLGLAVASKRERVEVAASAGFSSPSPATLAGRLRLGRALRTDRLVTGSLDVEDSAGSDGPVNGLVATLMIIDIRQDRVLHQRTLQGSTETLRSMFDEIALDIAAHDPAPPGVEARARLSALEDPPLLVLEAVMRSIVEQDPERQEARSEAAWVAARGYPLMQRRLADSLIESGRVDEGFSRLTALDPGTQPDPWQLHLDVAEILFQREELDAAARETARSIEARDTGAAHVMLARIALARGDLATVTREMKLAETLDPGGPGLLSILTSQP